MRKRLRVAAVASGIISAVLITVLGYIYFEDILELIKKQKTAIMEKK